jgi:hypothetical protein
MIIWPDFFTALFGALVLALCTLIYGAVRNILKEIKAFATHIAECEMRNSAHQELHKQVQDATNRRLELLEVRVK